MIIRDFSLNNNSYSVEIGYDFIKSRLSDLSSANAIYIISSNVREQVINFINNDFVIIVDDGEQCKDLDFAFSLIKKILLYPINKSTSLIVIGGGSLLDLGGFLASILLRGINLLSIPTTLLAQADSSVGGKVGLNSEVFGKNMIGAFYLPKKIYCDVSFLESLNNSDYISGYAEIFKHALINDVNFLDFLFSTVDKFLLRDADHLSYLLDKSIYIKHEIIEDDFYDVCSKRALLNFGHSFAHALEAASLYSLRHGHAVSVGIVLAAELSYIEGLITKENLLMIKDHLKEVGLPVSIEQVKQFLPFRSASDIISYMLKDKKNNNGKINLILLKKLGKAFVFNDYSYDKLFNFIEKKYDNN